MIEAQIGAVGTEEVSDFLGDGGEQRTATWPRVDVHFVDTDSGAVLGIRSYTLRERSAIETMDDLTADAIAECDRLVAEYQAIQDAGIPPDSNLAALHLLGAQPEEHVNDELTKRVAELRVSVGSALK